MPNWIKGCGRPQNDDTRLNNQPAHPIKTGTIVRVPRIDLARRPFDEGLAQITAPMFGKPDIYRVRFEGERVDQVRFILGGPFQHHSEECIAALHAQWLASLRHARHLQALLRSEEGDLL